MILPRVSGNHRLTSLPVGNPVAPEKAQYWTKLNAYQCHSSVIKGRIRKLIPIIIKEKVITNLDPCRSINLPIMGAVRLPIAAKDRDALIAVLLHPKVPSRGSIKTPNA